jgi:hypothetical protein
MEFTKDKSNKPRFMFYLIEDILMSKLLFEIEIESNTEVERLMICSVEKKNDSERYASHFNISSHFSMQLFMHVTFICEKGLTILFIIKKLFIQVFDCSFCLVILNL